MTTMNFVFDGLNHKRLEIVLKSKKKSLHYEAGEALAKIDAGTVSIAIDERQVIVLSGEHAGELGRALVYLAGEVG